MAIVTGSPGEYSLGSLNDSTGWIALFDAKGDVTVSIRGTFVGTISIQFSDQPDETKTRITTLTDTYTTPTAPLGIPREIGGWFRLIMTAYASGTAYVGVGAPVGPGDVPIRLRPQMTTNVPVGDSFL